MKAADAAPLVREALDQVAAALPPGERVVVRSGSRGVSLSHVWDGDIRVGPVWVPIPAGEDGHVGAYTSWHLGFGTWIPFLPRTLRKRLALQDIGESVLDAVFASRARLAAEMDFNVRTRLDGANIVVSYLPIGAAADARIDLAPVPLARLR